MGAEGPNVRIVVISGGPSAERGKGIVLAKARGAGLVAAVTGQAGIEAKKGHGVQRAGAETSGVGGGGGGGEGVGGRHGSCSRSQ